MLVNYLNSPPHGFSNWIEFMPSTEAKEMLYSIQNFSYFSILKHFIEVLPEVLIFTLDTAALWLIDLQTHMDSYSINCII